ncbi:hypothetical protein OWR29_25770 [Actinoplanes sp. Pm04-4]|uniref:Uncharacterized protein n=1 Tax=Paractinoplanes pyxinae TaxID=2997416 RepID=A0ABT4B4L4_9ACTN|nr:hypothetical protein [Actinoplanes pyxinae]MCY1141421.1 hypothetical protein [Actinoplanes pyxinae]
MAASSPSEPAARETATASRPNSPSDSAVEESLAPVRGAEVDRAAGDRWARLISDPAHAPEHLALAAVDVIGPRAREWAASTSAAYPTAGPAALARLAGRQFTRFGALTSVFGAVSGSYAAIALLAGRALTDAELVLHLAAAHGLDPTDPRRAVDLLVITGVHETAEEAEAAVSAAAQETHATPNGDAVWRLSRLVVPQAAAWTALRSINRAYPGTSLLAALLTSTTAAQATTARATSYYRRQTQLSHDSGRAV